METGRDFGEGVVRESPEDETSVVDKDKAQELGNQENANRTIAANFRKIAIESAGGKANLEQSDNPLVKELLRQAAEIDGQGDEVSEKASLDYDRRQAKLMEYTAGLFKDVINGENALSRGEALSGGFSREIKLPEDAQNLGVDNIQAQAELRANVLKALGVDIALADKAKKELRKIGNNAGHAYLRSALPHTYLAVKSAPTGLYTLATVNESIELMKSFPEGNLYQSPQS